MVQKEKYKVSKDRLRALMAISSRTREDKGPCPGDNEMAAFMDGGLTSQAREAVMAHLDACPSCYNEWLAASAALSDKKNPGADGNVPDFRETAAGTHGYRFAGRRTLAAGAIAFAACLIVFFWFPGDRQPDLPGAIEVQYELVLQHHIMPGSPVFLTDPEGRPGSPVLKGYGFVDTAKQPSPGAVAFVSGIRAGWERIQAGSGISDLGYGETAWGDYYHLGVWYALVTSVCGSGEKAPDGFWESQKEIIGTLEGVMSSRLEGENEAVVFRRSLGRIKSLLSSLPEDEARTCRSVRQELEVIIQGVGS